jgi:hypothetical protein
MNTPSHPDDEQNAFFTYFGYGLGMRVIDVQNNRGEGGQNEIGPEIMHDIGMLRTEELMACIARTAPSSTSRAPSTTAIPTIRSARSSVDRREGNRRRLRAPLPDAAA